MNLIQAIILGIVQGITEFLPISSTAHLTLAGKWMGLIDPNAPEQWTAAIAVIQLGTLVAVLIYFAKDIWAMVHDVIVDSFKGSSGVGRWSKNSLLAWQIVLGTIPVVVIGLAFKHVIEGALTKKISVIASSMIGLAILLYIAEKSSKHERNETTWKDALAIGFGQCLALIPGSSRSGSTIMTGLFRGLARETAARFSFLLSIPAVLASGMLELWQARHFISHDAAVNLLIATVVSGIVGYASIAFLLNYLKKHSTFVFIWYRLALGIVLWVMLLMGAVS